MAIEILSLVVSLAYFFTLKIIFLMKKHEPVIENVLSVIKE